MGIKGRDEGCNVMNIQYTFNWNFHYEFPLYNEYILILKRDEGRYKMATRRRKQTV
jgi:hypothetical protein